jgi:putative oxidoreductase
MDVIELVGRLLFAAGFLISPSGVLKSAPRIAGLPTMRRFPTPVAVALIRITCLMSMTGAVLVALGLWLDLGALLILGFLVPVTLTMHRFWELEPGLPRKQRRDAFLSNASLAGAAMLIFAAVNASQHVDLALVAEPLFGRI